MDYFAYESKSRSISVESTPDALNTPTIFIHDAGKSPSRPTCIRYSASFFTPEECEPSKSLDSKKNTSLLSDEEDVFNMNSLSSSLPSPPITQNQLLQPIMPSLSLPSSKATFKRRFSTPPNTLHAPRLHVLLVDDNGINLQILSRLLNLHMSDSIEHMELVKSGVKALEVLKCRPFDLILMDIDMPVLNGIETTKHIRSTVEFDILPQNRKAPIVAVTTNDSQEWRQTYTKIGMNGCVSKPISPKDLKLTLSKVLGLHLPIPPYTPE